ncbi:hypothetical protein OH77DRAFT_1507564 [Trametes cingulata]|nr:hypothetical protein OH77DRAFT_1507564 [Trametes cingulata]
MPPLVLDEDEDDEERLGGDHGVQDAQSQGVGSRLPGRRHDDAGPPRPPSAGSVGGAPMQGAAPETDIDRILAEVDAVLAHEGPQDDEQDVDVLHERVGEQPDEDHVAPPDPEYGYSEDVGVPQEARRREGATLENSGLDDEAINRLRHPPPALTEVSPVERAALRMFLARGDASQDNYEDNRAAIMELHPEDDIPSYDQIKRRISELTGIDAIRTDMCINSCVAFTGPFANLEQCPHCRQARYESRNDVQVPRRTFQTFPVGPQIQAMYASPENAQLMRHRADRTREILRDLAQDPPVPLGDFDDLYKGDDYLAEVASGRIKENDTVLMFSLEGAQLYANKSSDCWFFIWVLFDLPPDLQYKKRYGLPGGREGLQIWHASRQCEFQSEPDLILATADGPGMAYLSGLVGHQGGRGCRLYLEGLSHAHISLRHRELVQYIMNMRRVVLSGGRVTYQRARLETGSAKPSIFTGIPRILPLPACFGADPMHLITLNLTDLVLSLLRGTIPCEPTDDRGSWTWAVLADKASWKRHGKLVAAATPYLPGSFDRPLQNPAEKLSSGYKAWEYLLYVYGLLPGLLRPLQHDNYFRHFCKLVSGIPIILQRRLPHSQLRVAHLRLIEHAQEFETLYYQRRVDRLHFVRQSLHATTHRAPEVARLGPGSLYTQWTLENLIGDITREMRQHVTPYANVSERALRRCQVNALKAMIPAFADAEVPLATSRDLGDNYRLLHARDRGTFTLPPLESGALRGYLAANGAEVPDSPLHAKRWARLQLPNGQIARTAWKEALETRGKHPRRARMVKLRDGRFAEVRYFLEGTAAGDLFTLAMLSLFSPPDNTLLRESFGVLWACDYGGANSRLVVDAKSIVAVVAMVPLPLTGTEARDGQTAARYGSRFFLVEKPGLDIAFLGGITQDIEGDDDDNDIDTAP